MTTVEHWSAASLDDLERALVDPIDSSLVAEAVRLLEAATLDVEAYLGRRLIVRPYTFFPIWSAPAFVPPGEELVPYRFYPSAYPLLDLEEAVVVRGSRQNIVFTDELFETVSGFAGYRRADQTLAALQAVGDPDLSALATLPPLIPPAIVREVVTLAAADLEERARGAYAESSSVQHVAGASATVRRDPEFKRRRLARLAGYKLFC